MNKISAWLSAIFMIGLIAVLVRIPGEEASAQGSGFPSLPTFQGVNVGQSVASGFGGVSPGTYQVASNAQPSIFFSDNSQSAGSRIAAITYTAGLLKYQTCPDSGSGCTFTPIATNQGPAFIVALASSGATLVNCNRCGGSPTAVRNSAGNYTVNTGATVPGNIVCGWTNTTAPEVTPVAQNSSPSVNIYTFTPAGTGFTDANGASLTCMSSN